MIPELVVFYLLTFAGFTESEAHKMTCVARYESAFNPKAINIYNDNGSIDVGLFQINTLWFKSSYYCELDRLRNPMHNVMCARQIYEIQGPTAWVAYKKHKDTCDAYKVEGVK